MQRQQFSSEACSQTIYSMLQGYSSHQLAAQPLDCTSRQSEALQ